MVSANIGAKGLTFWRGPEARGPEASQGITHLKYTSEYVGVCGGHRLEPALDPARGNLPLRRCHLVCCLMLGCSGDVASRPNRAWYRGCMILKWTY